MYIYIHTKGKRVCERDMLAHARTHAHMFYITNAPFHSRVPCQS